MSITPFLKWAGGKRWLVANYPKVFPTKVNRYFEPFLGSGAVFFHIEPKESVLGDVNKDLIATYKAIKKDHKSVFIELKKHQTNHSDSYYYHVRASRPRNIYRKAARFIYLNRTCWNGLYRVNKSGAFNVPVGTRSTVIFSHDDFEKVANALQSAKLRASRFEQIIAKAELGDLLFVDPPYTVMHNNNNFVKYNEELFGWKDQIKLHKCLCAAKKRGVQIILTNANHHSVKILYRNFGRKNILTRLSLIAAEAEDRKASQELLITCNLPEN
jgi:DNA adenine methylase